MLSDNVRKIQETLKRESAPFGRCPKLIAVTKTAAPSQILPLKELGVQDIAENRVQVLQEKIPFLEGKFSLHLIGQLQTNKVKYIIREVCLIHSVDRQALADEIDRQADKNELVMPVLLQVNVSGEAQKAGIAPADLPALFTHCEELHNISVRGLMTILPYHAPRDALYDWFLETRKLLESLRDIAKTPETLTELSMGMSQDYDLAARAGATMVRVGRALFNETSV